MTLASPTIPSGESWRDHLEQLQAIFDLTEALTRADGVESVYEAALDGICRALRVERAAVLLFDPDGVMRFKAWRGLSAPYRAAVEGHTPWTPETRDPEPVLVADVAADPDLDHLLPALKAEDIWALGFFPLSAGERVIGKFMVYYDAPHGFSPDEVQISCAIASQVSFAIERQRTAVRLAEGEARYRDFMALASEGVLVLDAASNIALASRRFLDMVRFSEKDLIGCSLLSLLHSDDIEPMREYLRESRGDAARSFECRFLQKDGGIVWGTATASSIADADGLHQRCLMLITDIGREKAAESRYRALAASIPQMALMFTDGGSLDFCNTAWTDYTGLDLQQTIALGTESLAHSDDKEALIRAWIEGRRSGNPFSAEIRIRRSDGQFRWHMCTANPLRPVDGDIDGWISTATDIHEAKCAQEAQSFLSDASAVLGDSLDSRSTLKSLAKLIVPRLADFCVIGVVEPQGNDRLIEVACVDPESEGMIRQLRFRDWLVTPGASDRIYDKVISGDGVLLGHLDDAVLKAIATTAGQASLAGEIGLRSLAVVPLKSRNSMLGGLSLGITRPGRVLNEADLVLARELGHRAGVSFDNASLYGQARALAEQLAVANEAKDEFLGLVSHEMRTPITTIFGNAQVLQRIWQIIDETDRRSALADIERDAERLWRIIENMLVLARIEGDEATTEPVLLNRLVAATVEGLRNKHLARAINFRTAPGPIAVMGQPTYIELVLANLVGNAHKYSPPEAPIVVTIEVDGSYATVSVLDSGPGVPAAESRRMFEPFYRASHTPAAAPGAGLGLAVCRRLMESQGGQISAENRLEGGLRVFFDLPLVEPASDI
ncbi:MAG TPA: PAS domain S-box protein [Dehalococcoidia bacterium]